MNTIMIGEKLGLGNLGGNDGISISLSDGGTIGNNCLGSLNIQLYTLDI